MKRTVLLVGLAVLLAAVGTLSVLYFVRQADARALAGKEAVRVLVAGARVPAGTAAGAANTAGLFHVEPMPADSVPADALGSIGADVENLVAGADIPPGQLVLRSLFVEKLPTTTGLPIPDGKIAVTVALGATEQVAGYVRPGSMVAVFDTRGGTATENGNGEATTRVLLAKVEVLAVGPAPAGGQATTTATPSTSSTSNNSANAAAGGQIMLTVAVDTTQAERLILGTQTGTLHLGLLTDRSTVPPGARVDTRSLFGATQEGN